MIFPAVAFKLLNPRYNSNKRYVYLSKFDITRHADSVI